ncbi:hypothetical protein VNO80_11113 [Phaseolus coccineus]|uniref:Uncharacterized protein n=1 Tax=Phaseolus coccineus TaxID=3886 RepID=A0AAN9RF76_PHACN
MPPLCYPFDSQFQERQCRDQEVSSANVLIVIFFITWLLSFASWWLSFPCPPIKESKCVGLGLVSVGVVLCLVLWILYANGPKEGKCLRSYPCQKPPHIYPCQRKCLRSHSCHHTFTLVKCK